MALYPFEHAADLLKVIQTCTVNHGKMNDDKFGLYLEDLKRFLGLPLAHRVLAEKKTIIK